MDILRSITEEYKKDDIPAFGVGDTVRVHIKIKEGNRERIQVFEGFVLKRQNGGISETFTVRKISSGVGVEKTFPLHSPKIEKIEVVRKGDVRRAKLNYMRERTAKPQKLKLRNSFEQGVRMESLFSLWIQNTFPAVPRMQLLKSRCIGFKGKQTDDGLQY